ncbi:MAG: hypothetical protein V4607_05370 [Pseudomonadota bacterium]
MFACSANARRAGPASSLFKFQRWPALTLLAILPWLFPLSANAAGTRASTPINNTATVNYTDGGIAHSQQSNQNILRVDELLGVTLVSNDAGNVLVLSPENSRALSFSVTNIGNGEETFQLSANTTITGDQFDPQLQKLVLDSNNNGVYDPDTDAVYIPGSNDPLLSPDQSVRIFLISNIPSGQADGAIGSATLQATAVTGSGAPGTDFPGKGDNGVDAVVGVTGASAQAPGNYQVSAATLTLVKSQTISDSSGGGQPTSGATVTYTLTLQASGSGRAYNVSINDPVPLGVSYIAGSLRLDGVALSDSADADAGQFSGNTVEVQLGQVQAPSTHTIVFQVTVN